MILKKETIYAKALNRNLVLYIGLPDTYQENQRTYPVLYMQDGHNVFLEEDAFIGKTWGMLDLFDHHKDLKEVIVIGLNCSQEPYGRLDEYSPFDILSTNPDFNGYGGKGHIYVDYLVNVIKPMIDQRFRTIKEDSAIMGSSLGAYISLYAGLKYPHIFKRVGSLSGSYFVNLEAMIQTIKTSDISGSTYIYMDTGDQEVAGGDESDYLTSNQVIYNHLVEKIGTSSVTYKVIKGGKHSEEDWAKRLYSVMKRLYAKN